MGSLNDEPDRMTDGSTESGAPDATSQGVTDTPGIGEPADSSAADSPVTDHVSQGIVTPILPVEPLRPQVDGFYAALRRVTDYDNPPPPTFPKNSHWVTMSGRTVNLERGQGARRGEILEHRKQAYGVPTVGEANDLYAEDVELIDGAYFELLATQIRRSIDGHWALSQELTLRYGNLDPDIYYASLEADTDDLAQLIFYWDLNLLVAKFAKYEASQRTIPIPRWGLLLVLLLSAHIPEEPLTDEENEIISVLPGSTAAEKLESLNLAKYSEHPIIHAIESFSTYEIRQRYIDAGDDMLEKRRVMNDMLHLALEKVRFHADRTRTEFQGEIENYRRFEPVALALIDTLVDSRGENAWLKDYVTSKFYWDWRHWTAGEWIVTLSACAGLSLLAVTAPLSLTGSGLIAAGSTGASVLFYSEMALGALELLGFAMREYSQDYDERFNKLALIDESHRIMTGDQDDSLEVLLSIATMCLVPGIEHATRSMQDGVVETAETGARYFGLSVDDQIDDAARVTRERIAARRGDRPHSEFIRDERATRRAAGPKGASLQSDDEVDRIVMDMEELVHGRNVTGVRVSEVTLPREEMLREIEDWLGPELFRALDLDRLDEAFGIAHVHDVLRFADDHNLDKYLTLKRAMYGEMVVRQELERQADEIVEEAVRIYEEAIEELRAAWGTGMPEPDFDALRREAFDSARARVEARRVQSELRGVRDSNAVKGRAFERFAFEEDLPAGHFREFRAPNVQVVDGLPQTTHPGPFNNLDDFEVPSVKGFTPNTNGMRRVLPEDPNVLAREIFRDKIYRGDSSILGLQPDGTFKAVEKWNKPQGDCFVRRLSNNSTGVHPDAVPLLVNSQLSDVQILGLVYVDVIDVPSPTYFDEVNDAIQDLIRTEVGGQFRIRVEVKPTLEMYTHGLETQVDELASLTAELDSIARMRYAGYSGVNATHLFPQATGEHDQQEGEREVVPPTETQVEAGNEGLSFEAN